MGNIVSRDNVADNIEDADDPQDVTDMAKRLPAATTLLSKAPSKKRHVTRNKSTRLVKTPAGSRSKIPLKKRRMSSGASSRHSGSMSNTLVSTKAPNKRPSAPAHHLPPTPPQDDTASETDDFVLEPHGVHDEMPPLKSPRLPIPSPLQGETPSKYGLRAEPIQDVQAQTSLAKPKHHRIKSSDVLRALGELKVHYHSAVLMPRSLLTSAQDVQEATGRAVGQRQSLPSNYGGAVAGEHSKELSREIQTD